MEFDLRVLSLGAGVQSTALYLMALDGLLPEVPDFAIFADTQVEPPWVYENLARLCSEGHDRIPIHIATVGSLGDAIVAATTKDGGHFSSIPFWAATPGGASPGWRHCTKDYKINAINQYTRKLLGLRKGQHAVGKVLVEEWVGISTDEATRRKPSRDKWKVTRWPLLDDFPIGREGILLWLRRRGWPPVGKSACTFCPWRGDLEYAMWRDTKPEIFEEACRWDDLLRANGPLRGMRHEQFVSRLLVPLRDLPPMADLRDKQLNLFEMECEGMCGL